MLRKVALSARERRCSRRHHAPRHARYTICQRQNGNEVEGQGADATKTTKNQSTTSCPHHGKGNRKSVRSPMQEGAWAGKNAQK